VKPQLRQITSCRARAGQHARPSHKHCKPCAKHAHAPPPRVRTCLRDFHLVEFSYQPVPFSVKQRVETTVSRRRYTQRTKLTKKNYSCYTCTHGTCTISLHQATFNNSLNNSSSIFVINLPLNRSLESANSLRTS
jgi:hypothetical protein